MARFVTFALQVTVNVTVPDVRVPYPRHCAKCVVVERVHSTLAVTYASAVPSETEETVAVPKSVLLTTIKSAAVVSVPWQVSVDTPALLP
jgi:hypothetical protein